MKTLPVRLVGTLLLSLIAPVVLAQNRSFTSQYSFGDSLSDNGNLYALTARTQPPSPPYNQGRFSNGPTFVELLGQTILPAAALSSQGKNRNFAFGGATVAPGGPVPNLAQQIGLYTQSGLPAQPTDLFTVLIGANDMISVLSSPATPFNPASIDVAAAAAASGVVTGLQSLVALGARNIVVLGLPNLGATPRSLAAGGPGGAGATFGARASTAYNNELVSKLPALAGSTPGLNLVYVDLPSLLDPVFRDPARFGFTNTTSYVLAPAGQGGGGDPGNYVYFDDIHPTAKTHALLASLVTEMLNPEPRVGFSSAVGRATLILPALGTRTIDGRTGQLAFSNREVGRSEAFVEFNYADGNRVADGWQPEFDFTGQAATAGVDVRLSDDLFIGGAVDAGRLRSSVTNGGGFQVENGTGRAYLVWRGGPVSLVMDANYGALHVKDIRRPSSLGGMMSSAKTGGEQWGAGVRAAWELTTFRGFTLRPWAGLRTERTDLDPYAENDIAALAVAYDRQKARSSTATLGIDSAINTKLGHIAARFDLRAAWHGEVGSRQRTVSGRLANNFTVPTALNIDDGDGGGFELGGAVTVALSQRWSTSLGYTGELRRSDDVMSRVAFSVQTGL